MLIDAGRPGALADMACDVAIVGAGAAGIPLALELAGFGHDVILVESGGLEFDDATQALYDGEDVGLHIDVASARLRYLGGSTNHWGGRSRPFEPADFAHRPWIPGSGWPLPFRAFETYLPAALDWCEIELPPEGSWSLPGKDAGLPLDPDRLVTDCWRFSPPTRFGERYRSRLERSATLRLLLNANLVDIELAEGLGRVSRLHLATLDGRRASIAPRHAVLATGGLENARLLLASNRQIPAGLGNGHDNVGRYLMGHPIFEPLRFTLAPGQDLPPVYGERTSTNGGRVEGMVRLAGAAQERLRTTAMDAAFYANGQFGPPGYRALRRLWRALGRGRWPDGIGEDIGLVLGDIGGVTREFMVRKGLMDGAGRDYTASVVLEQAPDRSSRVMLGEERDALGMPRIVVDWRLSALDRHSLASFARLFAEEIGRQGIGRARLEPWVTDDSIPLPPHGNSAHHLGTTRMSAAPQDGVVDPDCRVHGLDNLFIAGSSVFPTGGSAHPTLNLVALALRLADHLDERLRAAS